MMPDRPAPASDLPCALVVLGADGSIQFGWHDPETGAYYAEADGSCIADVIGIVEWHGRTVH